MVMEPTATNAVDMSRPFHSVREAVVEVFEEQSPAVAAANPASSSVPCLRRPHPMLGCLKKLETDLAAETKAVSDGDGRV
jgi:hypothetical protein